MGKRHEVVDGRPADRLLDVPEVGRLEPLARSEDETELFEFVRRHAEAHDVSISREHVEKIVTEV